MALSKRNIDKANGLPHEEKEISTLTTAKFAYVAERPANTKA